MCKYCEQKLNFDDYDYYDNFANQIEIAEGGWTGLYIGIDKNKNIVLRACGDAYTDDCIINFCPFCGRKVNKKYTKGKFNE